MGQSSSNTSLAASKLSLGDSYWASRAYNAAAQNYQEALILLRVAYKDQPQHPHITSTLYKLSLAQAGQEKFNESGETLQESLVIHKRIRQDASEVDVGLAKLKKHYEKQLDPTASALKFLSTRSTLSREQEADYYKQLLNTYRQDNNKKLDSLDVVVFFCGLTINYIQQDKYSQAVETFKECLEISRRIPVNNENISISLSILAKLYSKNGDLNEAIKHHKECLDLNRQLHASPSNHPYIVMSQDDLAEANEQVGNLDEAIKYTKEAFGIKKNSKDPFNLDFAECLIKLIDLHRKSNYSDKKTRLSKDLLDLCKTIFIQDTVHSILEKILSELLVVLDAQSIPLSKISCCLKMLIETKNDVEIGLIIHDLGTPPKVEPPKNPNPPSRSTNLPKKQKTNNSS